MTIGEVQKLGETTLFKAGIESRRIDTSLILEIVTSKPRAWALAHPEHELSPEQLERFMELLNRRSLRTPLVHLTNNREFYGLDFYIDERVLTPRVETEKMVAYAVKYAPKDSRLIDIGTGSGALAVAIKKHRPDLEVWATDVSAEALEVAHKNAKKHKVEIKFLYSDLFDAIVQKYSKTTQDIHKFEYKFQTVVTNLPYLKDDADLMPEVQKEPGVALFGGEDGLDLYRRFLKQLSDHLDLNGYLFTECDPWQHEKLVTEASAVGLKLIEPDDYFILGFQIA